MFTLFKKAKFLLFCHFLLLTLIISSCASKKDVLYFQGIEDLELIDGVEHKTTIKEGDLLSIIVSAENDAIAAPFNIIPTNQTGTTNNQIQGYLVDNNGNIEMPKIGSIEVAGLIKEKAVEKIKEKLLIYIKNPIVNLRIRNFTVTVLGDVANPGTFNIPNDKVTVLEAVGYAGDLRITGKRQNVLVIRELENGNKITATLNFTDNTLFSSPFYYLQQNDVVVVDPNFNQVQRSASNPNTGIFFSIASLLLSIFVIFSR